MFERHARGRALGLVPVAVCFVVAGLTLLWARQPTYDPYSWLVWARQLAGESQVAFSSAGASGWKPLPVLVALPFNWLGGDAAPIWLVWVARTAMLLLPVAAWRLGRLAAGVPGAVAAALSTLLLPAAFTYVGGLAEPAVGLMLMIAVIYVIQDQPGRAWVAGLVAVLGRPEALAAVVPWGAWETAKRRLSVIWFTAGVIVTSLLWAGGDWIGTGQPLGLLGKADKSKEPERIQAAANPGLEILKGLHLGLVIYAIAIATFIAAWIWRDQVSRLLGLVVVALVGSTVVATQFVGYPGVTRYLVPAVPLILALVGVGIGRVGNLPQNPWLKAGLTAALLAILFAVAGPETLRSDRSTEAWYRTHDRYSEQLAGAISAAGGRQRLLQCGRFTTQPRPQVSAAAWMLDVQLKEVLRGGTDAIERSNTPMAIALADAYLPAFRARVKRSGLRAVRIARSPNWTVWSVTSGPGGPCVRS